MAPSPKLNELTWLTRRSTGLASLLYVREKMKLIITSILFSVLSIGCKEQEEAMDSSEDFEAQGQSVAEKHLIRSIRTYGTDDDFGIELNGDRAFLNQDARKPKRREIPFEVGESLVEEFYTISNLESFSGTKIQDQRTDTHLWINVYDEKPEKYSEGWVEYAIPLELMNSDVPIAQWCETLGHLRKKIPNKTLHPTDDQL